MKVRSSWQGRSLVQSECQVSSSEASGFVEHHVNNHFVLLFYQEVQQLVHIYTSKCVLELAALLNGHWQIRTRIRPRHATHKSMILTFAINVIASIMQNLTALTDAIVHIQTSDLSPNLNKYLVQVINKTTSSVHISHLMDINLRIGFNATSTAALDTQDKAVPYLEPVDFGHVADKWHMHLVIPAYGYHC